ALIRARALAALLGALAEGVGCANTRAVLGSGATIRIPAATSSPDEVFGHQVRVRTARLEYYGELLGCDADGVFLLLNVSDRSPYQFVDGDEVTEVRVRQPGAGPWLLAWTILGTLSTLSHGFWLVASSQVWGIAGSISTSLGWNP